jgi:uncharacterized protein (DUF1810 family)
MNDPYDLERFVRAQNEGGAFSEAWRELQRGRKTSHWMWFVFPQIARLGRSAMSTKFAISSIGEAQAYLRHPLLGIRLIECANVLAATEHRTAEQIFGGIDARKLHSSIRCSQWQRPRNSCSPAFSTDFSVVNMTRRRPTACSDVRRQLRRYPGVA